MRAAMKALIAHIELHPGAGDGQIHADNGALSQAQVMLNSMLVLVLSKVRHALPTSACVPMPFRKLLMAGCLKSTSEVEHCWCG